MLRKLAIGMSSLAVALGGMSTSILQASAHAEPVTITVAFIGQEITNAEAAAWNKAHPDIRIKLVDIGQQGKLQALLAAGNAPDIIRVHGASTLPLYIEKGIAMDLQPYFNASKNVFNPADFLPPVSLFKWNGKSAGTGDLYGFPKDAAPDLQLWYNKTIFQKAHIPLPSKTTPMTWPQVLALAKKLTITKNGKVAQYGLGWYNGNTEANTDLITVPLAQLGKSLWSDDYSKAKFEDPDAEKILSMWVDTVKNNLGPNSLNKDPNYSGNIFGNGNMAMMVSGYWLGSYIGSLKNINMNNFAMVPGPIMPRGHRDDPTEATGGIIYSGTKHPKEAWQVFEYLFAGQPADDRAASGWGFPVLKSKLKDLPQKTAWQRALMASAVADEKYMTPFPRYNPYLDESEVDAVLSKYMVPVYYGRDTVQDAAQKIDKDLDSYIQTGMQDAGK